MHAFQDSVPEFIQKRFSPDFISTVQGGEGGLREQFFRSQSGSKIFIHKALCHDARIWPISCLACFYAWADLVIPMALCTLFRLFNFIFFCRKFFLGPLYGALHCLQNIFHERGFFVEPLKKHDYKEALVTKIARFSRKTNKNMCPCDFELDFTISMPWIHMLQNRNFHWISHVEAMM